VSESVRLDKWLWAARFFKTRSLAGTAAHGGRVKVGGAVAKASRAVRPGELVAIDRGPFVLEVTVLALANKRGPAKVAQTLYEETEDSISRREAVKEELRAETLQVPTYRGGGRPTKKDRRDMMKLSGRSSRRRPRGGGKDE